jgi:hypothetical protein
VASSFVIPRIEMLSAQNNQAVADLRAQGSQLDKLWVWKDESLRRLEILEKGAAEQQRENRRVERVVHELKIDVTDLRIKMGELQDGLSLLAQAFQKHGIEMREAFVHETRRHQGLMRLGMTFAATAAAGVALLIALHGSLSGEPLLETLLRLVPLKP